MANPFKEIIENQSVPDILKEKVLSDVDTIKLTLDIADLFLVKYPNTIGGLLNNESINDKNNKKH